MKMSARVDNSLGRHAATLSTDGRSHEIAIAPRPGGFASSATGGELLCLAAATCYCNDLYREARKRGIEVARVEVEAEATLDREGGAIERISYRARVTARAPESAIVELMRHTDTVAEVQNTLRRSCPVELAGTDAERIA
jgi:organic hydroperoxide reductase OsmC/OhrA